MGEGKGSTFCRGLTSTALTSSLSGSVSECGVCIRGRLCVQARVRVRVRTALLFLATALTLAQDWCPFKRRRHPPDNT